MNIAIIGGGAAGFFAAINCAANFPHHSVFIFEKSNKALSKVRVSGGGRCNVTHACFDNPRLVEFYPRGSKELRNAFSRFSTKDTVEWFESRGVKLKIEDDGRMFPVSDNSETIIECLWNEAIKYNVTLNFNSGIISIRKNEKNKFELHFQSDEKIFCDRVIITTGGSPNKKSYDLISELGHTIIPPVPSLFTFNISNSPLKGLEGISVQSVNIKMEGSKLESTGPVLITHWGISGPAVLRLSALASRWLFENNYSTSCFINWFPEMKEDQVRLEFKSIKENSSVKKVTSNNYRGLPLRLWDRICKLSGIEVADKWGDISNSKINKLIQNCSKMNLTMKGKTTFKEEFVTCGGVHLKEVNMQTMESKKVKGIYFAGEVLDIDGITGGFNFQSAWTTGFLAGLNAGEQEIV
jgi:predicted Rossmann fold flavoprotein